MLTAADILDALAEDPFLAQRLAVRCAGEVRVWEGPAGLYIRETGNPSQYILNVVAEDNGAERRP